MKKSKKRKLKKRKQNNKKKLQEKHSPKIVTHQIKPTILEKIKRRYKHFIKDHFIISSFVDTLVYMILIYGSIALLYYRTN